MRPDRHAHGAPCWFELATLDAAAAKRFYTALLGWQAEDTPMPDGRSYTIFRHDGRDAAAGFAMQPAMREQGVPPHWAIYFAVDDVDAAVARAGTLGATVVAPAFDVMEHGRMAVLRDPEGAVFALWQARAHPGVGVIHEVGAAGWVELATRDLEAATRFYAALLGWTVRVQDHAQAGRYGLGAIDGYDWAGFLPMNEQWGEMPAHWSVYWRVADVDAAAARVRELGGAVHHGPFDAPGVGRLAVVADGQGAHFYLIRYDGAG